MLRLTAAFLLAAFAVGCGASTEEDSSQRPRPGASSSTKGGDDTAADESGAATTAPITTPASTPAATDTNTAATTGTAATTAHVKLACTTDTDSITASYWIALLRAPEPAGLQGWLGVIQDGQTRLDVLHRIIQSPEFTSVYAGLTDEEYVVGLYHHFLDRDPDDAGKAGWLDALGGGVTRTAVALSFSDSPEFHDPAGHASACYQ